MSKVKRSLNSVLTLFGIKLAEDSIETPSGYYDFAGFCVLQVCCRNDESPFRFEDFELILTGNTRRIYIPTLAVVKVFFPKPGWFKGTPVQAVEITDTTPIEVPLHLQQPLTLKEEIQRFVMQMGEQLRQESKGDFDDFDDFYDLEVDEDELDIFDQVTVHQMKADQDFDELRRSRVDADDKVREKPSDRLNEQLEDDPVPQNRVVGENRAEKPSKPPEKEDAA